MVNPMTLEGKTTIVTGAVSGIGRQTASLIHELGSRVLMLDFDEKGLETIATNLGEGAYYKAVVTDFDAIKPLLNSTQREIGHSYTGFVHCAGIPSVTPLRALSNDQFERVMKVNVQAGLNLAKNFATRRGYDTSQQGSMVFVSSVYGVVWSSTNVAYATSKAAVIGMTKSLAIELSGSRIRVNCVAPRFVKTDMADDVNTLFNNRYEERVEAMHPLGWGKAIDIANGIAFLLSDASCWTTGATFNIDGGFTAQKGVDDVVHPHHGSLIWGWSRTRNLPI